MESETSVMVWSVEDEFFRFCKHVLVEPGLAEAGYVLNVAYPEVHALGPEPDLGQSIAVRRPTPLCDGHELPRFPRTDHVLNFFLKHVAIHFLCLGPSCHEGDSHHVQVVRQCHVIAWNITLF